jgi:hypothetical protein
MAEVGYQNNADNRNRTDNARNAFCADSCAKKSDFKSLGVRHDVVLHLKMLRMPTRHIRTISLAAFSRFPTTALSGKMKADVFSNR